MDYVSLIKADPPSRVSKQFRLDASGKLEKTAVAQLVEGRGKTVVIETAEKMVRLLKIVSEKDDIVLLPSGVV